MPPYAAALQTYRDDGGYRGPNSAANRAAMNAAWKPVSQLMWQGVPSPECKMGAADGANWDAYYEACQEAGVR